MTKYEVVHCETQEQWNFVLDNSKLKSVSYSTWDQHRENSCFSMPDGCYSRIDFYKSRSSLILSFQEWCDKFDHINPFIKNQYKFKNGDKVKIIANSNSSYNKIGDIGTILDMCNIDCKVQVPGGPTTAIWSLLSEIELVESESTKQLSKEDELLTYARKHYPIGTRYIPAHVKKGLNEVSRDDYSVSENKHVYVTSIYLKESWNVSLYYNGQWAEIVSKSEEVKEDKPQFIVGRWYKTKAGSYVKYLETTSGNSFIASEYFMYDNYKKLLGKGTFGSARTIDNFIEIPLEEIQQYLPEGHIDRIVKISVKKDSKGRDLKEFILGKWYKRSDDGSIRKLQDCTITYSSGLNYHFNSLVFNQILKDGIIENVRHTIANSDIDLLLKEIDITSLLKKESIKTNPFKPGDFVVLVPENYDKSFYKEAKRYSDSLPKNTPLKVLSLNNNGHDKWNSWFIIVEGNNIFSLPFDCFRLATSSEISSLSKKEESFEIGDWCKVNSNLKDTTDTLGKLYFIPDQVFEITGKQTRSDGGYWLWETKGREIASTSVTKLKDHEIPKQPKEPIKQTSMWIPKKEDVVIAIRDTRTTSGNNPIPKGTIKKIIGIDHINNIWFEWDGKGQFPIEDFELYVEKKEPILSPTVKYLYNEGDYIVCNEEVGEWIKKGEIAILGGLYWNIEEVNTHYFLKAKTIKNPKGNGCIRKVDFRHATKEEIEAYKNGIRNISDIPKQGLPDGYFIGADPVKESIKREPKIGDYVVVTQPGYADGKIDRLKSKNTFDSNYWELEKNKDVFSYKDNQFRFATDAEIKEEFDKGHVGEPYGTKLPYLSDFLQDEVQLLQPKEDKRFNTSVNKIESVKIQLKQKSKSIKF